MAELDLQKKFENSEAANEKKEAAETPDVKAARIERQKSYVQIMAAGTFASEDLAGMLDHAGKCSAVAFREMLEGNPAKGIPPLSEVIMKEKLWKMAVAEEEKKHPGIEERLNKKIAAERGQTQSVDRRILLAEAAWETEYEAMAAIMPKNLLPDLERYYGRYDRTRAAEKHKVTMKDQPIPDCDKVTDRMRQGVLKRIQLEYKMLANEHFPKETVELWADHIDKVKTPEAAIEEFKKMTGELEGYEGYIEKEAKFNERREKLMKENPAAYDYFLRLYNSETHEKLFATRDKVMDDAVAYTDDAWRELGGLTKDGKLLDKTKYAAMEEIAAQIKLLSGNSKTAGTKTEEDQNATDDVDMVALRNTLMEKETEMFATDRTLQRLTIQETALESAGRGTELSEHQDESVLEEKRQREMRHIREGRLKDQVTHALGKTAEKEGMDTRITDQDKRDETTVLSTDVNRSMHGKNDEDIADLGLMLRDTKGEADREGLHFLTVSRETGEMATAKDMKDAAEETELKIEARREQLLKEEVASGGIDAKVLDISAARTTKQDREKRRKTVFANLDRLRKAA